MMEKQSDAVQTMSSTEWHKLYNHWRTIAREMAGKIVDTGVMCEYCEGEPDTCEPVLGCPCFSDEDIINYYDKSVKKPIPTE